MSTSSAVVLCLIAFVLAVKLPEPIATAMQALVVSVFLQSIPPATFDGFVDLQCAITQKSFDCLVVRKTVALVAMAKLVALSKPRALERRVRDPLSPPPGGVALTEIRGRVSLPCSEDNCVVLDSWRRGEFVELQCANRRKIVVGFMVRKSRSRRW